MQGNKKTFINSDTKTFYKEYTKQEFLYLKMLHDFTGLSINLETINSTQFITMPAGNVISIDTIPAKRRNNIKHIIVKNIPFMLEQISYLNNLGIYYSDCLQWLYHNNKLYLIDFDIAYMTKIDYNFNNFNLFTNFLYAFNIDYSFISESLDYLDLFKTEGATFDNELEQVYNTLNDPTIQKNHIYYSSNRRHIQVDVKTFTYTAAQGI